MLKIISYIRKTFVSAKFIEFCLLGTLNTFNNALFSSLAVFLVQENVAAVFGYMSSLTIAFFLSCKIIFKHRPTLPRYLKFLLAYIPNFIIFVLVTFITINTMQLPQFWGTILAAAAGGPITFLIIKIYAFGNKKD